MHVNIVIIVAILFVFSYSYISLQTVAITFIVFIWKMCLIFLFLYSHHNNLMMKILIAKQECCYLLSNTHNLIYKYYKDTKLLSVLCAEGCSEVLIHTCGLYHIAWCLSTLWSSFTHVALGGLKSTSQFSLALQRHTCTGVSSRLSTSYNSSHGRQLTAQLLGGLWRDMMQYIFKNEKISCRARF